MPSRRNSFLLSLVFCVVGLGNIQAQTTNSPPPKIFIAGISVEGNSYVDEQTIVTVSGLRSNMELTADKMQTALKNLWQRGQFSDVDIVLEKNSPLGLFLKIKVTENPRLSELAVVGNEKIELSKIKTEIGKSRGDVLTGFAAYSAKKSLEKLYDKEGYNFASVKTEISPGDSQNYSTLTLKVNEGANFQLQSLRFLGNQKVSSVDLAGSFEENKTKQWYEFWRSAKFDKKKFYEVDIPKLVKSYRSKGYLDADTTAILISYDKAEETVDIAISVVEGKQFFLRKMIVEGNTIFPTELIISRLDMKLGEPFDIEKLNYNLFPNAEQTDVNGLYTDLGYIQAMFIPSEIRVGDDSIDVSVRIIEGTRFSIRYVEVAGNNRTKDHVIRRELYTRPGDYFDRSVLIRSIRGLGVLNYFNPESLRPDVKPADATHVDVLYKVEERSTDTFNASVGYAGIYGMTGAVGITLNNFDITDPLRGGGGQVLNFQWEFGGTLGSRRVFSLGFSEPWLMGSPTSVGASLYDSNDPFFGVRTTGLTLNGGRRLRFPDDFFRLDYSVVMQRLVASIDGTFSQAGVFSEVSLTQTISRLSFDNMLFPTQGSRFSLSTKISGGAFGIGSIDMIRANLNYDMITPLVQIDGFNRLVLAIQTEIGYVSGLNSNSNIPRNQLFFMGGNSLGGIAVSQLRGYENSSIGPGILHPTSFNPTGGRFLTRYTTELRFAVSLNPMPIYTIAFAEAGNNWNSLSSADLFNLYRSAGVGLRVLINPIGLLGFDYGYGFDATPDQKSPAWHFHFQFGR